MKKVIFLGYSYENSKLIIFFKKNKNISITKRKNIPPLNFLKKFDLVVSYGLRKKIPASYIKSCGSKMINLHISYLPYNRGAHPNFWSWVKNTPKGVSIHFISEKIDAGDIIFQRKINFPNDNITFRKSYNMLRAELDALFIRNFNKILSGNFIPKKQKKNGSTNFKKIYLNTLILGMSKYRISKKNFDELFKHI